MISAPHKPPAESLPKILPHHLRELRASGLSDETIIASGIYSETSPSAIAALLEWQHAAKKIAPAMVFPYIDAEGHNGYARCKPDRPRTSAGSPVKYESPRGRENQMYLPPGVATLLPTEQELLITEGEKKALAATQAGFPTIGLVGVYGWKTAKKERLLLSLEEVKWAGREVRIVFDSDAATNLNVQDATRRLSKHLQDRGAKVRIARLPEGPPDAGGKPTKVGLDDFLVANGPGPLRKLLDEAVEPEPLSADEIKLSAASIDPAVEVEAMLKADSRDGMPRLRFWKGSFWHWQRGRYVEQSNAEIRGRVVRALNRNYHHLTTNVTANVFDQLRAQAMLSGDVPQPAWIGDPPRPWQPRDVLPAQNGLLHLPGLVRAEDCLLPPTPRFWSPTALEFDIDLGAPRPDTWLRFLDTLWGDDGHSIDTLAEWFGYVLTSDTSFQKILLLIGPKRSGKGTIARVLRALVGPNNTAGPTLAGLATNFGLWSLVGKTLAIVSDARLSGRTDQAVVVERLLSISGEDALTIDRKMMEPITCQLPTRLMIVSNELPRLADASGAVTSRFIALRLSRSFYGREDRTLTAKLMPELPGILLWAIAGWQRLNERGHFAQPDAAAELLGDMAELSSPIGAFIRERCIVAAGRQAAVDDLFREWKAWCEANGRKEAGTQQTFGRDLLAAIPTLGRCRPRCGDERFRAYEGIGLQERE